MVRRLMLRGMGISITAWALCVPGLAAALGVGEYELHSYLNEPLNMEVSLTDLRDLTEEELLVNLAADKDFERAGVERQAMHADLRFNIDLRPDGTGVVTITTRQPVREPYVSFLVEYLWPTGRLLREYTVLLDPPSYAAGFNEPVAPARQQQPQSAPQPPAQQPARQATRPLATADAPAPSAPSTYRPADSSGPRRTHTVRADETLWRIASQNRPTGSVSVQQMMVVIQQMNQDAFINGNVNLVREGAVLRLPSEQEVREISTRDAIARVAEQNRQWREMLQARGLDTPSRQPLDGTPRTIEGGVAGTGQDSGRVTLVAPDSASGEGRGAGSSSAGRSGGTASGDTSALQNELAIRDENLDRLRRENSELGSRLDDLEAQVNTGEQLLKLRNDQITRLQEELRRLQEERGVAVTDESLLQPVPALEGAEDDNAAAPATGDATDEDQIAAAPAQPDDGAPGARNDTAEGDEPASNDTATAAPAPAERQAPPPPRVTPPPAPESSLLDKLLNNPLILGAVALVLALLALLVVRRRKAGADTEAADDETQAFADDDDFGDDDDFLPAIGDDDDDLPLMADEDDQAAPAQDPLEQVDVFMAYGQYPQALSHLRSAINAEPGRIDLKKRLLDVLAESNDKPGFDQEATKLTGLNDELDGHIAALRPRLAGASQDTEEELSFDDLAMDLSEPASTAPAAGLADDDDEQALDFSADLSGNRPAGAAAEDSFSLDDDDLGDFELTLPDAEPALSADDDSLSFSLDDETPAAADNRYSLNGDDDGLSDEEVSAALSADPVLELDSNLGTLDSDDSMDFGELKLDDVSDEFADTGSDSVTEESLDLSLDDLSLDDLDTGSNMAEAEDDALTLSLDEDDLGDELSLDDTLSVDETPAGTPVSMPAAAPAVADDAGLGDDDDFDFLGETDENATKLDLARAYIDMGDTEGARDILNEVVAEGNDQQQAEARDLLSQVG